MATRVNLKRNIYSVMGEQKHHVSLIRAMRASKAYFERLRRYVGGGGSPAKKQLGSILRPLAKQLRRTRNVAAQRFILAVPKHT